jgi:hypothetical protein
VPLTLEAGGQDCACLEVGFFHVKQSLLVVIFVICLPAIPHHAVAPLLLPQQDVAVAKHYAQQNSKKKFVKISI